LSVCIIQNPVSSTRSIVVVWLIVLPSITIIIFKLYLSGTKSPGYKKNHSSNIFCTSDIWVRD
jgi:hypothetical protein